MKEKENKEQAHLSCSPNFQHVSCLDERTLTYEPVIKYIQSLVITS